MAIIKKKLPIIHEMHCFEIYSKERVPDCLLGYDTS